jgi:hypothetical protein
VYREDYPPSVIVQSKYLLTGGGGGGAVSETFQTVVSDWLQDLILAPGPFPQRERLSDVISNVLFISLLNNSQRWIISH